MKILITILITILAEGLYAQNKKSPFDNSYYRLDNVENIEKYSMDSVNGHLLYYMINKDSIHGLIFPTIIYKTYDDWTKDNLFNFVFGENYSLDDLEFTGKLIKDNANQYSDVRFFKRHNFDYNKIEYIDSTQRINLVFKGDTLLINGKLFKKDITGRIFQRFTGY